MAVWPVRGQKAPNFWDGILKNYIDEGDANAPAVVGEAITDGDVDIVGPIQDLINASGVTVAGTILLPPPTGVAATDNANLAATIAAAANKVIIAQGGVYAISSFHDIPNGVDLRGQGGGSTSRDGRTVFRCTTAGAGISISGGGGLCGGFEIDGDTTANTPFKRLGGLGANARLFANITVHDNTGASSDLAHFYGAQNDLFIQCGFAESSRDIAVFDQGFGGSMFIRCQWRGATRYHHRYDDDVAGGVYAQPTDIHHYGGIMEGSAGTSLVIYNAAANITYSDQAYYCVNAPTGPMVDVVSGAGLAMHNPWLQCTSGAPPVGSIGIKVRGTAEMSITGRAILQNLETGASVDGAGSFIYTSCIWRFFTVTNRFGATGGGTVAQIASFLENSRFSLGAVNDFTEISQPISRDRFLFSRTLGGALSWYPNTAANFTPDVQILRRGVGAVGVPNGTRQVLVTGTGTTAQRPAAGAATNGAIYFNTDTDALESCDGTSWYSGGGAGAVDSVNGQTGVVVLDAADVGAADAVHTHTASQVSDSTSVGRSILTAADAAAVRTAAGAAATSHTHTASQISDSTTVGRAVLTAVDAAAARTAIGAGTSSLVLGTTAGTALAGDTAIVGAKTPNSQSAAYTLALTDAFKVVEYNSASAGNITVPPNSTVAFPIGTMLYVVQKGAGKPTLVQGAGVTLQFASSLTTRAQYSILSLYKSATDTWVVGGDAQ